MSEATYRVVGRRFPRHDGSPKATGTAVYGTDIELPGMLAGKILRSPYAHARIQSIDTRKAEAFPGVKAVITAKDTPMIRYGFREDADPGNPQFADKLPLAEPESMETSFRKALRGIDRGLAELAKARNQDPAAILDATKPLDLFRIGATVDPDLRPSTSVADLVEEEDRDDWNVETEMISEEDQTLGRKGRPQ